MSRTFKGTIANGATQYVGINIVDGHIGTQIAWLDATSAATITLELTNYDADAAPVTTAGTYQWVDSGESITGPSGSAAGSALLNMENVRQRRGRLKIVASANCSIEVWEP